jgi:hypothetical protein
MSGWRFCGRTGGPVPAGERLEWGIYVAAAAQAIQVPASDTGTASTLNVTSRNTPGTLQIPIEVSPDLSLVIDDQGAAGASVCT